MARADRPCGERNALKGIERCNCMFNIYVIRIWSVQYLFYIWSIISHQYHRSSATFWPRTGRTISSHMMQHVLSTGLHWLILTPELDVVLEGQHGKNLREGENMPLRLLCCDAAGWLLLLILQQFCMPTSRLFDATLAFLPPSPQACNFHHGVSWSFRFQGVQLPTFTVHQIVQSCKSWFRMFGDLPPDIGNTQRTAWISNVGRWISYPYSLYKSYT